MSSASLAGMDTMTISVRLFAILRERAGQDRIALELDRIDPGTLAEDCEEAHVNGDRVHRDEAR